MAVRSVAVGSPAQPVASPSPATFYAWYGSGIAWSKGGRKGNADSNRTAMAALPILNAWPRGQDNAMFAKSA
jgi:hypothetical protein